MPSAYLQWQFHSGERVVAPEPLVSLFTCSSNSQSKFLSFPVLKSYQWLINQHVASYFHLQCCLHRLVTIPDAILYAFITCINDFISCVSHLWRHCNKWRCLAKIPHNFILCSSAISFLIPNLLEAIFLQSWKTLMRNGYLWFFVVNTHLDSDVENQLHLCTEIMCTCLAWEIVTLCIRVKLPRWCRNMHTKIIILHTVNFVYIVICYKLIWIAFFIKYIWVFTKNMLLIEGTEPLLIQASWSKNRHNIALYGLPQTQHCFGKNVSKLDTG